MAGAALTKAVTVVGLGLFTGLFLLVYLSTGGWIFLAIAGGIAAIPAALILVIIKGRLSSRPRPE
jgi:hypothetical protein